MGRNAMMTRNISGQAQSPVSMPTRFSSEAACPRPIPSAPTDEEQPLLLFCPEQGGWHTGVCFRGIWLAYIDSCTRLSPTHWLPFPQEPD
jgi:hypothetical protein